MKLCLIYIYHTQWLLNETESWRLRCLDYFNIPIHLTLIYRQCKMNWPCKETYKCYINLDKCCKTLAWNIYCNQWWSKSFLQNDQTQHRYYLSEILCSLYFLQTKKIFFKYTPVAHTGTHFYSVRHLWAFQQIQLFVFHLPITVYKFTPVTTAAGAQSTPMASHCQ